MEKTIKISEQTHEKLLAVGTKGETFDSLLDRLVESYNNQK